MPSPQNDPAVNRLLEGLPASHRRRMLAGCETVELAFPSGAEAPAIEADGFGNAGTG